MIGSSHVIVTNYLDDVARMLADLDPAERAEVLAGLREHLDAVIDPVNASDDHVHQVLSNLGPPDAIAREALSGNHRTPPDPRPLPTTSQRPWVPVTQRSWIPPLMAGLLITALGLSMLAIFSGAAFVHLTTSSPAMDFPSPTPTPSPAGDGFHPPSIAPVLPEREPNWVSFAGISLGGALFSLPLWGTAAFILLISPLFTAAVRALGATLIPLSTLIIVGGAALGQLLAGGGARPWSLLITGPAVAILAVITVRAILHTRRRRPDPAA